MSSSVRKPPLWLRRLDRVKGELKSARFPRTAEEGVRRCVMLSTMALRWFEDSIRMAHPGASKKAVDAEKRHLLARLSAAEARWLVRWRKERVRYFDDNLAIVLTRVVECLQRGQFPYVVIGAWALSIWGITKWGARRAAVAKIFPVRPSAVRFVMNRKLVVIRDFFEPTV